MPLDATLPSEILVRLAPALPYLEPVGWVLLHALWQGAVLAGLLAFALWALRDQDPRLRHALSVGTLAALLVLPVGTVLVFGPPVPGEPPAAVSGHAHERLASTIAPALPAARPDLAVADAPPPVAPAASTAWSWTQVLPLGAALWLVGVFLLLLRLCGSLWYVRRLRTRGTTPLPDAWARRAHRLAHQLGIRRSVRFAQSQRVAVPMVVGWWRPLVLLPVSVLAGMPPAYVQALLVHELSHVRRHDALVGWLQVVAETLLFFHPATWWISRQIRTEREHGCDDHVVAATGQRTAYARALAQLEALRQPQWHPAPAASDGALLQRIRRILGHPVQQRLINGWRAAAGMAATAVLGLLAAGVLLAATPASTDDERAGASMPVVSDTTDRTSIMTREVVVGQDTLEVHFRDLVAERYADSAATIRFRGDPSVRVFIRNDSLRVLRTEDFGFMADSLQQGSFGALMRGFATLGESMGTLGNGLEALMDSLDTRPKTFEGRLWWGDAPSALPDTLELPWSGLSPEERQARLDSLMAQARALAQPSPEQRARRDSLLAQARALHEPSPEQRARIDSLRMRLREFTELTPERRARMDSLTAMLRNLHQPSAEERARMDSLMTRAQVLVRPTDEQQARLDSLRALIQQFAQPSSEQLRRRAEALREQAERLEARAQALEQDAPPPPEDRPPPPTPPEMD